MMKNRGYDEEQGFIAQNKVHYLGLCTVAKIGGGRHLVILSAGLFFI